MILRVLFNRDLTVELPTVFNNDSMRIFVNQVVDEQRDAKCSRVVFDFHRLGFIEPVGVVVLSNLIEYFKLADVRVRFVNHNARTSGVRFLDSAGFFQHYLKRDKPLFDDSAIRSTTMPLQIIASDKALGYLYQQLVPWIGREVGLADDALETVRASLEEIIHNVRDHSGVDIGCTFAQHFPGKSQIQIAISDFGRGIPELVRTKEPSLADADCLRRACEEGFTTGSNVRNRGAGLPTLMRYVTMRNGGNVLLAAGYGELTASPYQGAMRLRARSSVEFYPGTLVRVILRTDTLERAAIDAEPQEFEWS